MRYIISYILSAFDVITMVVSVHGFSLTGGVNNVQITADLNVTSFKELKSPRPSHPDFRSSCYPTVVF